MARVVALTTFPVKGCAGTALPHAVLTPAGLPHDRAFLVVGPDGRARTQRRDPRLAVVRPEVAPDGARLTLRAPDAPPLTLDVDLTSARREVTLFGAYHGGIDQGDAVAAWLSAVLAAPSRLVRVPPEHDRVTDGRTPGTSAYADSCAVLLVSRASLDALNGRIAARGHGPVPMDRFRPNVVVAGPEEPHAEDVPRLLAIGGAELGFAKRALRCVVTTVDQESGARVGPEPLRTLADYRRLERGLAFGAKFAVTRPGAVAVGDEVVAGAPVP